MYTLALAETCSASAGSLISDPADSLVAGSAYGDFGAGRTCSGKRMSRLVILAAHCAIDLLAGCGYDAGGAPNSREAFRGKAREREREREGMQPQAPSLVERERERGHAVAILAQVDLPLPWGALEDGLPSVLAVPSILGRWTLLQAGG